MHSPTPGRSEALRTAAFLPVFATAGLSSPAFLAQFTSASVQLSKDSSTEGVTGGSPLNRIKAELSHQFFKGLPHENGFVYIKLLSMLKMHKLKKSVSLQQGLDNNLLSSFADPPESTPFPPARCAIKN